MKSVYAAIAVIFIATVLTFLSCSTRDSGGKYWHEQKLALFNVVQDSNDSLNKANSSAADRSVRLRHATSAKAYLASARNMATDQAMGEILGIDAVKMRREIDRTIARIAETSAPPRGRRMAPRNRRRKSRSYNW